MSTEMQTKVQASPAQNFTPVQTGLLQRQCALCNTPGLVEDSERDKENLTLQRSSVDQAGFTTVPRFGHDFSMVNVHSTGLGIIQTKLKINEPGDIYEQEADRVAEQVMRIPESKLQRQVEPEEETLQSKPLAGQITPLVQRHPDPTDEDEEEMIQAKPLASQTPEVTPAISSGIQSMQGGGQPLSRAERGFFEPRFGADFSNVRVHNGTLAASVAQSVNARAFTHGRNVVFGAGEYSSDALAGRKLLAHELTHVVQQNERETLFYTGKNSENTIPNSQELGIVHSKFQLGPRDHLRREPSPAIQREANQSATEEEQLTRPLTNQEWELLELWKMRGEVGTDPLTEDPVHNALVVADAIFCNRFIGDLRFNGPGEDPLLCVGSDVTRADPRVQQLAQQVTARGPIIKERLTLPLTDQEWKRLELWQSHGEVGTDPLTEDPVHNALVIADAIFCNRFISDLRFNSSREDPLLCVGSDVTRADPRVQQLAQQVTSRGPIINWTMVNMDQRMLHVMELLVNEYGFPENGAAGLVGNLRSESRVLPNLIEGGRPGTPMTTSDLAGHSTDFTAEQVMNRNFGARQGPEKPGIGIAQWTSPGRRAGLFQHVFQGQEQGAAILFNMDAQVDYLVTELQNSYSHVYGVLTGSGVSLNAASDEVVYNYEIPKSILSGGMKLPRPNAAVQAVFARRRANSQRALRVFQL